ncbi:hypothetical protein HYV11_01020 [Candidatus Dependentiae bacterium]|nr:hypothetical protein [Candidatus Dependentiae bacterium]
MKKFLFYFIVIFSFFHAIHSGFSGATLVKTPDGYIPIKQLKVGDQVYGVSKEGTVSPTIITHKVKCKKSTYFSIYIENQELIIAQSQKFLLPLKHLWKKTKKLHEKDVVLTAFHDSIQVRVVKQKHKPKKFYDLRLQKDHAFLVTSQDIIVHNMPLFNIGVLISFGGMKCAVETVWAGVCFFGLWLGSKFLRSEKNVVPVLLPATNSCCLNKQLGDQNDWLSFEKSNAAIESSAHVFYAQQNEQQNKTVLSSFQENIDLKSKKQKQIVQKRAKSEAVAFSGCPDPNDDDPEDDNDDDEFKKKHPNGRYQASPKHHPNSSKNVGKPPRNGQAALDSSVEVLGKNYRVAIQDGKIIVLRPHECGVYHGYIVNCFQQLDPAAQAALLKASLVINPKIGRLVK